MALSAEYLVQQVMEEMVRPDLARVLRYRLRESLRGAHGVECYYPDLVTTDPINLAPSDFQVNISLPANFRKLNSIVMFDQTGNPILSNFVQRDGQIMTDYFGFQQSNSYQIAGGNLNITFGVPSGSLVGASMLPSAIGYDYYKWPSYEVGGDGIVTSDSFMLAQDAYSPIKERLLYYGFMLTGKQDMAQNQIMLITNADLECAKSYMNWDAKAPSNNTQR